jgi:4-azaleucine resistance transporter AzlC
MKNPGSSLQLGVQAGLPIALGYLPIAIAFGALAVQADLTWWEATLMSLFVFAGASQFVGISLLLAGAGVVQIITTTFFLNLRHLIMSLAVNDLFRAFPQAWKNLLSFGITDETFALLTLGEESAAEERLSEAYVLGLMATAYSGWVGGTALGGLGAEFVPENITTAMTVGLYALFIGLLVPPARKSPAFAGIAITSMVLNTLFTPLLDSGWAIVLSMVLAAGLGVLWLKETAR